MTDEKSCPKCNGNMIVLTNSLGWGLAEKSIMPKGYGVDAFTCTGCGFVEFFMDEKGLEKFKKRHG